MHEGEKSGSVLAAQFALATEGCANQEDKLELEASLNAGQEPEVRKILERNFPDLNAFLNAIAVAAGKKDPYDYDIVKSYWIGGGLAEVTKPVDKEILIDAYKGRKPQAFMEELEKRLPDEIFLTHLTMVVFVSSSDLPKDYRAWGISRCMIASATIQEISEDGTVATVERDTIEIKDGQLEIIRATEEVKLDRDASPNLTVGSCVALHQGSITGELQPEDKHDLELWTRKVAESIRI